MKKKQRMFYLIMIWKEKNMQKIGLKMTRIRDPIIGKGKESLGISSFIRTHTSSLNLAPMKCMGES